MGKNRTFIMADTDTWMRALEELSNQSDGVLGTVTDPIEQGAFAAFRASLRDSRKAMFPYLPAGEAEDLEALCGTYMSVGLVFGRSPAMLVEVLRKSGAKIGVMPEDRKEPSGEV